MEKPSGVVYNSSQCTGLLEIRAKAKHCSVMSLQNKKIIYASQTKANGTSHISSNQHAKQSCTALTLAITHNHVVYRHIVKSLSLNYIFNADVWNFM